MRVRPLIGTAASAAFVLTLLGAPATLAGGGVTRMVDDDGKAKAGDCGASAAAPSSIQAAIDASGPGDTILVCPGEYQEQLTVEQADGLTIRGVKPWKANVLSPRDMSDPAWLLGIVNSTDVTVQWLKLTALATIETPAPAGAPACENVDSAIAVYASKDVELRANHIGTRGVHTLGQCGYDVGITLGNIGLTGAAVAGESIPFPPTTAKVVNNTVTDFKVVGIAAIGLKTRFDIVQNSIRFAHASDAGATCNNTASAEAPRAATRMRRMVEGLMGPAGPGLPFGVDCMAFGVLDVLGTSGTIRYNEVWSNAVPTLITDAAPAPALLAGFVEWGQGPTTAMVNLDLAPQSDAAVLSDNRVRGAVAGYALVGADLVGLKDNVARATGFGVFVTQTQDARVTDNRVAESFSGIWVIDDIYAFFPDRGGSSDNAFRRNEIPGSSMLELSCGDETTGSGTLGTANTWTDNSAPADSSDPSGICGLGAP